MLLIPKDFKDFLKSLNAHRVKYLVIGGYAVSFHGYPRATGDIDIFVEISQPNAEALVGVFREFGFDAPNLKPEIFLRRDNITRIGRPPMRLEVLTDISGVTFDECYANRIETSVNDLETVFISLPDLIKNKRASGRPKDLADIDNLRHIGNSPDRTK